MPQSKPSEELYEILFEICQPRAYSFANLDTFKQSDYADKAVNRIFATISSDLLESLPEKRELQLASDAPRELLPSEQELKLNKNHQAIGFNACLDEITKIIKESL